MDSMRLSIKILSSLLWDLSSVCTKGNRDLQRYAYAHIPDAKDLQPCRFVAHPLRTEGMPKVHMPKNNLLKHAAPVIFTQTRAESSA